MDIDHRLERMNRVRDLLTVMSDEDFVVADDQWTERELQFAERIIKLEDDLQELASRLNTLIEGGYSK